MRKAPRVYIVMFAGQVSSVWDTQQAAEAEVDRIADQRYAKNLKVWWREYRIKSAARQIGPRDDEPVVLAP